jgi:hypothetical protein
MAGVVTEGRIARPVRCPIYGEIVTRPAAARGLRPRRLSKLMRVLVSMWPVRVHLTTDSNAAEAGDGPLPVAGETSRTSATISCTYASVSSEE